MVIGLLLTAHGLWSAGRIAAQERAPAGAAAQGERTYDERIDDARRGLEGQVRVMLEFVRRTCAPTSEQGDALERAGRELVAGRLDEVQRYFTNRGSFPGDFVVSDRSLDRVIGYGLPRAVRAALDSDRAALFDDRRRALVERCCHAQLLSWVRAVDRKLLLSATQREELLRLFAAQWRQPAPGPRKTAIEQALAEIYEIDETDLRLDEFVARLERRHHVKIEFDDEAACPRGARITRQVNGVTLRAALQATLEELDLTYVVGDESLLLTTKTAAEKSDELLNWSPFFAGDTLLFQRSTAGRATVSRSLPEVPDSPFLAILRPAQQAVWADSQQGRIRRTEVFVGRNHADNADDRVQAVLQGDEDDGDGPDARARRGLVHEAIRAAEEKAMRVAALQAVAQADGLPPYSGTVELALTLALAIDELDAAAELSGVQRRKLELAGKIDIGRHNEYLENLAQKLLDRERQAAAGVNDEIISDVRRLLRAPSTTINDESSRFRKLQPSVLTPEQASKVADARNERREFAREAARQCVVALIAERAPLDEIQWDAAVQQLRGCTEPFEDETLDARSMAARIPGAVLKPVFDEAQWKMVAPLLGVAQR
jgi:hypothetical protein